MKKKKKDTFGRVFSTVYFAIAFVFSIIALTVIVLTVDTLLQVIAIALIVFTSLIMAHIYDLKVMLNER